MNVREVEFCEQPLLSIVIPTYNRAGLLEESLRLLMPLATTYGCEVVIADNASDDDTQSMVAGYRLRYDAVKYFRQSSNLGYDRNVLAGYRMARGKYVWLLGDSYQIKAEGFDAVIQKLKTGNVDAVVVNAKDRVKGIPSRQYSDASELLSDLGWHMTLLNSFIIPASFAVDVTNERYVGTYFIHLGVFFENIVRIDRPNIEWLSLNVTEDTLTDRSRGFLRGGGWLHTIFEVLVTNYFTLIMSMPHQLSLAAKLKCIRDHDRHTRMLSPVRLLRLRANGIINYDDFRTHSNFLRFCTSTPYSLILLVFFLPSGGLKLARWCKRIFKG